MLKAFARHPRVPLSREKLMEMARGREYEAFDRSLDVQISRLRKLIEPDPAEAPLHPDGLGPRLRLHPGRASRDASARRRATMTLRSPPLFWRTLLLVLLLIVASLAAWLQSFRVFERAPRAETIAQQVVSIAQLTRAALLYADPYVRRDLLAELARNEGIRIFSARDRAMRSSRCRTVRCCGSAPASIIEKLGPGTRVASRGQRRQPACGSASRSTRTSYWLFIERDPVARNIGTQWIGWAAVALLLSVLGAILITRVINRPLARLSSAARELGEGRTPAPLPAVGPRRDPHGQRKLQSHGRPTSASSRKTAPCCWPASRTTCARR